MKIGNRWGKEITRADARKAAKIIVNNQPIREAMTAIGYAQTTADKNPHEFIEKPIVQEEIANARRQMQEACLRHDLTIDRMAKKASAGLEAKRKVFSFGSQIAEVSDHEAQVKWWDRAAIMLGISREPEQDKGAVINLSVFLQIIQKAEQERGLA